MERGRLVDAMADCQAHIHGKKFAIYGDPDLMLGLTALPAGAGRRAGARAGHQRQQGLGGEDAGAVRQLARSARTARPTRARTCGTCARCCYTEPVDFLIGNTYGKYLERDYRHAADPPRLPDLRPPPPPPLPDLGLPGRAARAGDDPRQDLRRPRRATPIVPAKTDYSFDIIR